ncbi:MAG: hypothetical protein A4E25_00034 [Methanobacterium sp. PtaB.Bin024]|jgi:predicted RNase H-like nuclease (RuvC/YqgF family)|nr:MAG: hypothetical protein A4E25_00034 [Methanobacterium sp. PtaB.Bin024]
MVLITLTQLQDEAALPRRDVDLSDWSDAQLQSEIDWATSYIQRESNRLFTDTEYTQTNDEPHSGSYIYLKVTPIKSIETFTIDEVEVDEDTYTLNTSTGKIAFTTDPLGEYDYSITYIVCEDNTDIINIAKDICMDIVFAKLDGSFDEDDDISSIKSGNSQISYSKSTKQKIDSKIASITKNEIFLGII